MQCPLCHRNYSSGKFCTSCESPDGGAVRLVASERKVDPNDLDQYIKMLDVFLSDGFFSADEKETLRGLRQQYGISDQQHQSILKENGYTFRETMPVRMVLNRKTIQGYGAGQPCLAKVRLVNMERMPLQRVEIRYWLNSEETYSCSVRQLMPNKVRELDLDFVPQKSGQYALKMEIIVDPFVGAQTEYVVESTSFQVYSQSQLQSVHIHQSADNIVGNHKVHGTDMPKAMVLGGGQWDELLISPKQRAVEWGELTSQRLFAKLSQSIEVAIQNYASAGEFQQFANGLSLDRRDGEEFVTWEDRLKGVQTDLEVTVQTIQNRLALEQQEQMEAERLRLENELKRAKKEQAAKDQKDREENRLKEEGEGLYREIENLLKKSTYEVQQESAFKTLSTTCKKMRKPTGRQTLQTWVKKLTQTKSDLPKQLAEIVEARRKRLEAERTAKELGEKRRKREGKERKELEAHQKSQRKIVERLKSEVEIIAHQTQERFKTAQAFVQGYKASMTEIESKRMMLLQLESHLNTQLAEIEQEFPMVFISLSESKFNTQSKVQMSIWRDRFLIKWGAFQGSHKETEEEYKDFAVGNSYMVRDALLKLPGDGAENVLDAVVSSARQLMQRAPVMFEEKKTQKGFDSVESKLKSKFGSPELETGMGDWTAQIRTNKKMYVKKLKNTLNDVIEYFYRKQGLAVVQTVLEQIIEVFEKDVNTDAKYIAFMENEGIKQKNRIEKAFDELGRSKKIAAKIDEQWGILRDQQVYTSAIEEVEKDLIQYWHARYKGFVAQEGADTIKMVRDLVARKKQEIQVFNQEVSQGQVSN